MAFMQHPDKDVRRALLELTDALSDWERSTGRKSVLIFRETGRFVYRAVNGKTNVPDDVEDADLLKIAKDK